MPQISHVRDLWVRSRKRRDRIGPGFSNLWRLDWCAHISRRLAFPFLPVKFAWIITSSLRMPTNVLGTELKCCCRDPITGFYRDGYCRTGPEDVGQHTVCVQVTEE